MPLVAAAAVVLALTTLGQAPPDNALQFMTVNVSTPNLQNPDNVEAYLNGTFYLPSSAAGVASFVGVLKVQDFTTTDKKEQTINITSTTAQWQAAYVNAGLMPISNVTKTTCTYKDISGGKAYLIASAIAISILSLACGWLVVNRKRADDMNANLGMLANASPGV